DRRYYRPQPVAGVTGEELVEDGESIVALRSPTGGYVRLTSAEHTLWAAMDGERTVEQLALLGFTRFGRLLPVLDLVEGLRRGGFLADPPTDLYRGLRQRLERRSIEGWGRRIAGALRAYPIPISGVDALAGALYRSGGWLFFTRFFIIPLALFILAGCGAFALLAGSGRYTVIDVANPGLSLLGLWAALLVSFVLHELAHALAVKHFGRRVPRGGVMIYYGMPAAFVDTSDMWLAGRRARIIVSLAGPLCDLLVGSTAALAAALAPPGAPGAAAYTLAVAAYLAALCNLNPLLELDGYHILSDWLGMPNLRREALGFIRGPLWQKLRAGTPLAPEERVYTLYGLFAAAYTTLAVVLALAFWQAHLGRVLGALWAGGPLSRGVAVIIVVGVVAPLGLGLLLTAWWLIHAMAAWLARRGYGRSPAIVAATLTLLVLALAALPIRFGRSVETALIAPLLWCVALAAQITLHADYRRATLARALDAFLLVTALEILALSGGFLFPDRALLWSLLQNAGFALLFFAGFIALLDVDLHLASPLELAGSALLLVLAFLSGGFAIGLTQAARPGDPFALQVIIATPVYGGAAALALLLPFIAGMRTSWLLWSWLLLWLGIAAQTAAYVLDLDPRLRAAPAGPSAAILAAGLWTAAWCSHVVALRQIGPQEQAWPLDPNGGESERLQRAFRHTYAGLYLMFRAYHGSRRAHILDDRLDIVAATANWDVTLDRDEARIGATLAAAPLDTQGARYAEVLRYTVAAIEQLAGLTFARRAIQAAYDALPWPEREVADQRCFPHTPWARQLSRAFGDARAARLRLLREVERFAACDDTDLHALADALQRRHVRAGASLPVGGQFPAGQWIIEAGEVAVREQGRVVAELHRGATFGDGDEDRPASREYRASVDSVLLFVSNTDLQRIVPRAGSGQNPTAVVQALERTPFFQALPRATLHRLAAQAEVLHVPPRTLIVRQGQAQERLYVIVSGQVTVVRRDDGATPRAVARLGPTELFGDVELLRGGPAPTSVVATGPVELVALPLPAIAALLDTGSSLRQP
ncbi:MAG: cyclic nucleotide-binding domain-containing protein, partial [Chloroflexaceae bacterium]